MQPKSEYEQGGKGTVPGPRLAVRRPRRRGATVTEGPILPDLRARLASLASARGLRNCPLSAGRRPRKESRRRPLRSRQQRVPLSSSRRRQGLRRRLLPGLRSRPNYFDASRLGRPGRPAPKRPNTRRRHLTALGRRRLRRLRLSSLGLSRPKVGRRLLRPRRPRQRLSSLSSRRRRPRPLPRRGVD